MAGVLTARLQGFFTGDSEGYFIQSRLMRYAKVVVSVPETLKRTSVFAGQLAGSGQVGLMVWNSAEAFRVVGVAGVLNSRLQGFFTGDSEGYFSQSRLMRYDKVVVSVPETLKRTSVFAGRLAGSGHAGLMVWNSAEAFPVVAMAGVLIARLQGFFTGDSEGYFSQAHRANRLRPHTVQSRLIRYDKVVVSVPETLKPTSSFADQLADSG